MRFLRWRRPPAGSTSGNKTTLLVTSVTRRSSDTSDEARVRGLLTKPECEAFRAISVQVLVSVDRHRYVCGEDLEIFLRFLAVVADRDGVPHAEVNHQPPAMAAQWFDVPTGRWHVRESTGQVRVSDPVPRTSSFGVPMSTQEYRESKEKGRISICEAGQ